MSELQELKIIRDIAQDELDRVQAETGVHAACGRPIADHCGYCDTCTCGCPKEDMIGTVTLDALVDALPLPPFTMTRVDAVEAATTYAIQLGYGPAAHGTGGAYGHLVVSGTSAAIITDLIMNTDRDGHYTGDPGTIARIARGF